MCNCFLLSFGSAAKWLLYFRYSLTSSLGSREIKKTKTYPTVGTEKYSLPSLPWSQDLWPELHWQDAPLTQKRGMTHELYPSPWWWPQWWAARSSSWHRSGRGTSWHPIPLTVTAVLSPTCICRVQLIYYYYITLLVQLFVFPGVDSCLIFLFALFSMHWPVVLPQALPTELWNASQCSTCVLICQLLLCLNQGESASVSTTKYPAWWGQWWREFRLMVKRSPSITAVQLVQRAASPVWSRMAEGPSGEYFQKNDKWSWWIIWHICCIMRRVWGGMTHLYIENKI